MQSFFQVVNAACTSRQGLDTDERFFCCTSSPGLTCIFPAHTYLHVFQNFAEISVSFLNGLPQKEARLIIRHHVPNTVARHHHELIYIKTVDSEDRNRIISTCFVLWQFPGGFGSFVLLLVRYLVSYPARVSAKRYHAWYLVCDV